MAHINRQTPSVDKDNSNHLLSRAGNHLALKAAGATLVGLTALGLAGCTTPNAAAEGPGSSETVTATTEKGKLEQNVANRPEVGTPEYEALMTELFSIPYVEGQAPEDVLLRTATSFNNLLESGYKDAPQTQEAATEWVLETERSVNDMVATDLKLDYYVDGFGDQAFMPNWQSDPYVSEVMANFKPIHDTRVAALIMNEIDPRPDVALGTINFLEASSTDIRSVYSSVFAGTSDSAGERSVHLQATDEDGDGTLDVWRVVGPAQ